MSTFARVGRGLLLAITLGLVVPAVATAQFDDMPPPDAGQGEGKPLFGYLAAGAGTIAILFVVCMSARR